VNDRQREYERLIAPIVRRYPNPHALVLHICIHAAHDVLRRKVRRGKWLEAAAIPEDIPDSSTSALQNMAGAEWDAQVLQAIGLLSKNRARAILMHAVEEIPYGDIAATVGLVLIPRQSSASRVYAAAAQLRSSQSLEYTIVLNATPYKDRRHYWQADRLVPCHPNLRGRRGQASRELR
jgi:DNA-directed RNA polymerase specialized sigma24 family protein